MLAIQGDASCPDVMDVFVNEKKRKTTRKEILFILIDHVLSWRVSIFNFQARANNSPMLPVLRSFKKRGHFVSKKKQIGSGWRLRQYPGLSNPDLIEPAKDRSQR